MLLELNLSPLTLPRCEIEEAEEGQGDDAGDGRGPVHVDAGE